MSGWVVIIVVFFIFIFILLYSGEAKSSINGEKEGIKIRHGDNEFASGSIWISTQEYHFLNLHIVH